uniref:BH4_AAA_HYDROXYL_2 domain-containing protein n=1 Tax=Rhabditophanes sp. KR3021 TaxID=114890 RepID=A0AC35TTT0_9BILA
MIGCEVTSGAEVKKKAILTRRDTLVRQASLDRINNDCLKRRNTIKGRQALKQIESKEFLEILSDEGVRVINAVDHEDEIRLAVIFTPRQFSSTFLSTVVTQLSSHGIWISHLETRPVFKVIHGQEVDESSEHLVDIFIECKGNKRKLVMASHAIIDTEPIKAIDLKRLFNSPLRSVPWFPKHISELDKCMHVVTKYEPTEDEKHPGYGDDDYIKRRAELNAIANSFKWGDKIPHVNYTKSENETWRLSYEKLKTLRESHCCKEYRQNIVKLEEEGVITPDCIPQISDLNVYLQSKTGFQLRPCGGLLSARDFLASLAFRVFQATQYTRHPGAPHHSPEPDVIHEILGHVPMFSDPLIAKMSQEIGLLSLGASDEEIEKLSTIYWFIIEFGLCREDGKFKAIGAGLISAFGELQHACSDSPEHREFLPEKTAITPYEDSDYQPMYFVTDSLPKAFDQIKRYAKEFKKPFILSYNSYNQSIEITSKKDDFERKIIELQTYLEDLSYYLEERKNN